MRIDVTVPCIACGSDILDGAHYCAVCGRGQPTRLPAAYDQVELVDPRVRLPLLPTQPSPRNLFVGIGVVVLLLLATVPVLVIRAVFFGADDAVRDYFGALADRNAGAALAELEPGDGKPTSSPLLNDAALAGSGYHPPTNFVLTSLRTTGTTDAVAAVRYTIDGTQMSDELKVHRGHATNLFQRWHVVGGLRALLVQTLPSTSIQVGGASLPPKGSTGQLMAFPGAYVIAIPTGPLISARPVTMIAGEQRGGVLTFEVQNSARTEIDRQVAAYVDKCAASTVTEPPGCPFSTYSYSSSSYAEPVQWKVLNYPTLEEKVNGDGQVMVSSGVPGRVKITGGPGSYASPQVYSFQVTGVVSLVNGAVTFAARQA